MALMVMQNYQLYQKVCTVLAHCTEKFQSILLAFQVKLFAKEQEAMQLQFHPSYAIKGTQNFHYCVIQTIQHKLK